MGAKTLLTIEQFLQLPQVRDDDYHHYELWQGELVRMGETIPLHNWIRDEIRLLLATFARAAKLGTALCETGIQIDSNTLYRPDVAFWDAAHWACIDLRQSGVEVIPQLVVEVESPSDANVNLFRKADHYVRAGVHTVWVVLENPFEVHVFEAGGGRRIVRAGERLEAPAVLPGFSVDPSQLLPPA